MVNKQGEIRFGLGAIKGTGESATQAIIDERDENGPFTEKGMNNAWIHEAYISRNHQRCIFSDWMFRRTDSGHSNGNRRSNCR